MTFSAPPQITLPRPGPRRALCRTSVGQVAPPRRVDGQDVGAIVRRHPLDELERRAEAVHARARERQIVVAAEADEVEARADPTRRGARPRRRRARAAARGVSSREHAPGRDVLIADVAARAAEEPDLVAHLRRLVDDEERERARRARRRARRIDARRSRARAPDAAPRGHARSRASAERREHEEPRDGGHRVALVLPAHLAVQRDDERATSAIEPQRSDRDAPRALRKRAAPAASSGHDASRTASRRRSGTRCCEGRRTSARNRYSSSFSRRRHVRVVERELHDRAVRRPLAGEPAVRDRLHDERDQRRAAPARSERARARRACRDAARTAATRRARARRRDVAASGRVTTSTAPAAPSAQARQPRRRGRRRLAASRGRPHASAARERDARPDAEEERDLHAAEERPVERAEAKTAGGTRYFAHAGSAAKSR